MTHLAIVGAGLAGSSLTHWLLESGFEGTITLFDSRDPLAGSTGPTLLCHPFPGRSLAPHPHLSSAMNSTTTLLQKWMLLAPNLIRQTNMWRPLKGNNLKRLSQSHQDWWTPRGQYAHQNPWIDKPPDIRPVIAEDIEQYPAFKTPYPALKTGPAFSIDAQELYPVIHKQFSDRGVRIIETTVTGVFQQDKKWCVETSETSKQYCFDKVILAFGRQTRSWFPHLNITLQSGSLLRATPAQPTPIEALSLNGLHIGQHNDGDWVFGSTRWNGTPPPLENETSLLQSRLKETLPHAPTMTPNTSIWSGTRTIYGSDRMPLCGELPQHRNIFVLTALGSKGWLWGPWTANLLQHQIQGLSAPDGLDTVNLLRANTEDGWYSPFIHTQ